ncbi:MAG: DUF4397 domain-containing protein [Ignavibacteriae bacterium]|nr:DUF4397 domain-containing protein [Ignavibacteriota bacterium]MCB9215734.1 DUF4397 domain-containing protein [Ignavibacteria bacterium]
MKISKILSLVLLAVTTSVGVYGCEEDTTNPPVENPDHAEILFMHAVPAGPGVDLLIGDNTVITNATFGNFGASYSEIEAGSRQVRVFPTGTTTTPLVDATLDFTKDQHYTIFAIKNSAGTGAAPLVFSDNLTAPAAGKAHIRIAHLVADGPKVKLSFQGSGQGAIFSDVAFMDNTEFFTPVDAGAVTIRVQDAGTSGGGGGGGGGGSSSTVAPDLPFTLEDGGIYTIAVIGTVANSDGQIVVIKHVENHE